MFKDREQLSALIDPAAPEEWVDFPPSPEAGDSSPTSAKNRKTAPTLPVPVEPNGPNREARATKPFPEANLRRRIRAIILAASLFAILGAGAYFGSYWWTVGRFLVSTDDAYVGAKNAT